MKKVLSILLSTAIVSVIAPLNCFVSYAAPFSGAGTEENPYIIDSADDLIKLSSLVNDNSTALDYRGKCYSQTVDIDLGGVPFSPIGYYSSSSINSAFCGIYEGNYNSITGLYVDSTKSSEGGLFSCLCGTVNNLSVYGDIVGENLSGGITAHLDGGKLNNCSFIGTVISGSESSAGGLVGSFWRGGKIESCYFNGEVK